jgi:hypothetical protein
VEIQNPNLNYYSYLVDLAIVTSEDIDRYLADWQSSPPERKYTNLLDAEPIDNFDAYDLPDFYFDKSLQRYRYRDSGKFVSEQAVENLTRRSIAQIKKQVLNDTEYLIGNKLTLAEWEKATAQSLKKLHSWQYLIGKGGAKNMTQADNGKLGLRLSYEYGYLRGFAQDIADGKVSEAQLLARVDLYLNSSNGSFQEAKRIAHREAGYQWEKRIRTKQESCQSCLSYAAMGWQRIGTLPQPTQRCECRANCGCKFVFSIEIDRPQDGLTRQFGWVN